MSRPKLIALALVLASILVPGHAAARSDNSYVSRMALPLFVEPDQAEEDSQNRIADLSSTGRQSDNLPLAEAAWVNANAKFRQGRIEDARSALALASASTPSGARGRRMQAYISLLSGIMQRSNGDFGSALQLYRQAQQGFIVAGDERGQALALQSLGSLYADVGDGENALRYLNLARETYAGDPPFLLSLSNNLGVALQTRTHHEDAIVQFQRALSIADQFGMIDQAQRIRINIARSALYSGQIALARSVLDQIGSADTVPSPLLRSDLLGLQALLAEKEGRSAQATQLISMALQGVDGNSSASGYRKLHFIAYTIYAARNDSMRALEQLEAVRRLDDLDAQITASNRAAVIAAQFQFAAQDARISRLKAQQKQQEAEYQRNVAVMSVLGSLLALSLLTALLVSVIRSRNRARRDGAELAVTNQQLECALAAKAEFLASTSHELRTPLNGILGMTQIMLANPDLPRSLRGQVDLVHDAGTTMRALVDDILDVAKIEHGSFVITPRPTNLGALAGRVIRLFEEQSTGRGIVLRLNVQDLPAVPLMLDPDRMTQILFNLVGNALKFTPAGSVEVGLSKVQTGDGKARLELRVVDEGIGIAPEWHDAVFDMFRQVDGTRTRQFGGTGLGLAICRQLARAMGGDIALTSVVGEGSCFTVTLPWQEVEGELEPLFVAGAASNLAIPLVRSEDIPVVAADPLRAALLAAMVRQAGLDAVIVSQPQQIATLLSEAGRTCLIDAKAMAGIVESLEGEPPVAASLILAGADEGEVPETVAAAANPVEFARNAVVAALIHHARPANGYVADDSRLHQGVTPSIRLTGATNKKRRARAMNGI